MQILLCVCRECFIGGKVDFGNSVSCGNLLDFLDVFPWQCIITTQVECRDPVDAGKCSCALFDVLVEHVCDS